MGLATRVGVVAAVSCLVACETLLGSFEVSPNPFLNDGGPFTQTEQTAHDSGLDATTTARSCERPVDCPAVDMVPAACANADCIDNKCVYQAVDNDGDGHRLAGCVVEGVPIPGDDCADSEPTVFPNAVCSKRPDGSDIAFPNDKPIGACKAGEWKCVLGKPTCQGAVAPEPTENCGLKNDANCDGVPDDGCDCAPLTEGACGNVKGLPLPCKAGTRVCSPQGKWGPCEGNQEASARNCASTVDNDCNGAADQGEVACNCAGGVPQGGKASCKVVGGKGACAEGSRTCQPSADKQSGVFGTCGGPKPQPVDCKSPEDMDCNGVSDELEVACGSPCANERATAPGAQKFTDQIWGCAGTRGWTARGDGCAPGWAPCPAAMWAKYSRGVSPKVPTHKYWVREQLGWGGAPPECFVPLKESTACGAQSSMTVCPYAAGGGTVTDAEGNQCNWSGCTYGDAFKYNDYLGGCAGNDSAGTLCCPL